MMWRREESIELAVVVVVVVRQIREFVPIGHPPRDVFGTFSKEEDEIEAARELRKDAEIKASHLQSQIIKGRGGG